MMSKIIRDKHEVTKMENTTYKIVDRPGYFGKRRPDIIEKFDRLYGKGIWLECWEIEGNFLPFADAIKHYEEAYKVFLDKNRKLLDALVSNASDVYDNNISNVGSKMDYDVQETTARHYQDISVRRVVHSLGKEFTGDKLLQIRSNSTDEIGRILSPGNVPFHRQELIRVSKPKGWWNPGTIEEFWQSNKVISLHLTRHR